jgi:drug/metabolite transporter (DMT)-like permease
MNIDVELAAWRTDWLADQPSDTAMLRLNLRRLVDGKRRRMALALFGQLLFGVAMLAFSAWFASRRPTLEWILWAAVIWTGTFCAAGFSIWNTTGTWKAWSESNAAFLDLSRQRCLRELRAIHLGRWFLAVQLIIVASWLSWDFALHRLPMRPYFFGGAVTVVMAAAYLEWFAHRERRTRRDLERLDQLEDEPGP